MTKTTSTDSNNVAFVSVDWKEFYKEELKQIEQEAFKAGQAQALDWVKKEASKNACDYELDHKKNKIYYISIEMLKELINQRKNEHT